MLSLLPYAREGGKLTFATVRFWPGADLSKGRGRLDADIAKTRIEFGSGNQGKQMR